jgi:SAM-dependent methyltransferase
VASIRHRSALQIARKTLRELRRGAAIARDGGAHSLWTFVREEVVRNTLARLAPTPPPGRARVECNVCGWRGTRFLTHCGAAYVNLDAFCPRCMSYPRHRGFAHLLEGPLANELENPGSGYGRRLLFAPEPGMRMLLARHVEGLEGVDHRPINELVLHIEDIQSLSFADGSVDFFSCFHVLEHVPDDRAGLRELARVLHPRGRGVFNVPITFGRRETVAFGRPNPLANGHWFDYGEEFYERLVEAGFSGTGFRLKHALPPELYARLCLQDEMIFLLAHAPPGEAACLRDHAGGVLAKRA